ncbi:MAG: ABC transporter permease subunit [Gemmataceae bacterium]
MFNWISSPLILLAALILVGVQLIAALPWLKVLSPKGFRDTFRRPELLAGWVLGVVFLSIVVASFMGYKGDSTFLVLVGRGYAFILHLQLIIDFFIVVPALLTFIWPKGGAVALATFREGWRQPMFWLITFFGILAIAVSIVIPYITLGDDYKMMKQIGYDIIMLCAALFGVLASSISISEEIEGRTAVTLMSKPVNRRHFLIGKFLGILMACGAMTMILGLALIPALWVMPEFDKINAVDDSIVNQARELFDKELIYSMPSRPGKAISQGIGLWASEAIAHESGVILGFGQVMILVSISTALATRLPFVINLIVCLMIYFAGNLAPVVVHVTQSLKEKESGTAVELVNFVGKMTDAVMPALEHFKMNTAIIRETPLDFNQFMVYVMTVMGYSLIYTTIAVVVGLILFEDRDLA